MRRKKIRFLFMIIVGVAISLLIHSMFPAIDDRGFPGSDFLISIFITIVVWEGNLMIDHWMNRKFPWVSKPFIRVLVHFPLSIVYSAVMIRLSMIIYNKYVCDFPEEHKDKFMLTSIVIGVLISIILLSWEISLQFFNNWKKSLVEIERYKNESLQVQLQSLKTQLNPHFLFNNLSVLSSLVYKNQDKAVDFINQLAKVYRYLLDNRNNELVSLENELLFIQSYVFLLEIRFEKSLIINIRIPDEKLNLRIPPMALQMLIENSIKHNEASIDQPLHINISIIGNKIEINNNFQPRSNSEPSSNTGLQNIRDRYKYFTDEEVEVIRNEKMFIVRIPLLKQA